jgi:hypothetical protein
MQGHGMGHRTEQEASHRTVTVSPDDDEIR